jgi:hypothetical protein
VAAQGAGPVVVEPAARRASAQQWAFQQWMVRGGSRTEILAGTWEVLAQL